MQQTPQARGISIPYTGEDTREPGRLQTILTFLVFEAHGLRVGIELSLCVFGYMACASFVPWAALNVPIHLSTLISWFGCSFLIISIDQFILCRPVYSLKRAYLHSLQGSYDQALEELSAIGPEGRSFVKMPEWLYHVQRAEFLSLADRPEEAASELALAESCGTQPEYFRMSRARSLRIAGDFDRALTELDALVKQYPENMLFRFEQALVMRAKGDDAWGLKKIFKEIINKPAAPHFVGETTTELSKAYLSAIQLKTGEAEEGLEGITIAIERLRGAVFYVDTIRPILADLLLERAMYFATHKEPNHAVADLRVSMALCRYPSYLARVSKIREELEWRHDLILAL